MLRDDVTAIAASVHHSSYREPTVVQMNQENQDQERC